MSHLHRHTNTDGTDRGHDSATLMRRVTLACLPGLLAQSWFFGLGVVTNVITAAACCLLIEAMMLAARRRPVSPTIADGSALLTGVLLGAALPAGTSLWLILIGSLAAVAVAKHLYGGLGQNLFNPAMVGYALLLVSFPTQMSLWPAPSGLFGPDAVEPSTWLARWLGQHPPAALDALSGATPLDAFRHRNADADAALLLAPGAMEAWQSVALAWLGGGLYLLHRRLIDWRLPLSMLVSMALLAWLFELLSASGGVGFHLLGGAAIFGAFFIVTDPVSAASGRRARLVYGAGIGALTMIIRAYGGYPDAVAFAVLLMNLAAPLLDQLVPDRPRRQPAAMVSSDDD
ncbi:RnfABCDGE type electron transport complex subunit D [Halomonas litopenaei]|uniref:RnfABCDGE type electron transport complex subunit D n=1 Tax=Halomonas litopenaei TaxID=2109328 RepID=UPI003F9FE2F8